MEDSEGEDVLDVDDPDDGVVVVEEDDLGRQAPQAVARLHPFLARLRRALSRPDEDGAANDADNGRAVEGEEAPVKFDATLPAQHAYLGSGQEVSGRTILDEDLIQSLPLLTMPGFVLLPNQVFPLTLFHPAIIAMMRTVLADTKTFGVVNLKANAGDWRGEVGTTAEIFEYREESQSVDTSIGFMLKARGRQRFKLMSTRRQIDGNLVGTVVILPEVELPSIVNSYRLRSLNSLSRYSFDVEPNDLGTMPPNVRVSIKHHRGHLAALAPWPNWVYDMYDSQKLVERVHKELKNWNLGRHAASLPHDPAALSWWVAASLPMEDSLRSFLLSINCSLQRLRAELSFLSKCRVLTCRRCNFQLADQSEIFSLSREGPQNAFVNPGGHVHETLTVYRARNLRLTGSPSTEHSWFPGYAWTIAECGRCYSHIGWKFTATERKMSPDRFYGLSRRSIEARVQVPHVTEEEEEEEGGARIEEDMENRIVM